MPVKINDATINRPEGKRLVDAPAVLVDLETFMDELKDEKAWKKNDRNGITVFKTPGLTMVLSAFHKGAEINDLQLEGLVVLQVIKGQICVGTGEEEKRSRKNRCWCCMQKQATRWWQKKIRWCCCRPSGKQVSPLCKQVPVPLNLQIMNSSEKDPLPNNGIADKNTDHKKQAFREGEMDNTVQIHPDIAGNNITVQPTADQKTKDRK